MIFYWCIYMYIIYLDPKWPVFLLEKALFWGGWPYIGPCLNAIHNQKHIEGFDKKQIIYKTMFGSPLFVSLNFSIRSAQRNS